jgi:hypothetical protein
MAAIILESLRQAGFKFRIAALIVAVVLGFLAFFFWTLAFQKKHRRKRKHRGHGRIKPTLAQVGGLPPIRHEEKTGSGPQPFDP